MQMNQIVRRIQQVRRLPNMVGAAIARRAWRPDAGASRPAATKASKVAGDPKRRARRFGAGF
jgi:hypothetical protein